jgi:hypothetical protein
MMKAITIAIIPTRSSSETAQCTAALDQRTSNDRMCQRHAVGVEHCRQPARQEMMTHQARDEGDPEQGGDQGAPLEEEVLDPHAAFSLVLGKCEASRCIDAEIRPQLAHDRGNLTIPAAHYREKAGGFGQHEKQHHGERQRGKSAKEEGALPSEVHDQRRRQYSAEGCAQRVA